MNHQFGKIPFGPVNAGAVAAMSPADAKVYLVLTAHSRNWEASLSRSRIAELAGISIRSVIRAVHHLDQIRAIERTTGIGRGRTSIYRINGDTGGTVYQRKRVTRTSPNTRDKRVTNGARKGDKQSRLRRTDKKKMSATHTLVEENGDIRDGENDRLRHRLRHTLMDRLSALRPAWGDAILHAELADKHPDSVGRILDSIEKRRSSGDRIINEGQYLAKSMQRAKITLTGLPDRDNPLAGAALERSKQEKIAALKDYG